MKPDTGPQHRAEATMTAREGLRGTDHSALQATDSRLLAMQLLGLADPVFAALIENSLSAFALEEVRFDEAGDATDARVIYANPRHEQFSGIPHSKALGGWISALLPELDETWLLTAGQALKSGTTQHYRMAAPDNQGWFDGYFFPVTDVIVGSSFISAERPPATTERPDVAEFGELSLDLRARTALVADRELALTRTEFDVLAMLVENPRTALSSREIVEHVTGAAWLPTDRRKLAVHVHNLRRKLSEDGFPGYRIATVMGFGYRFDPDG